MCVSPPHQATTCSLQTYVTLTCSTCSTSSLIEQTVHVQMSGATGASGFTLKLTFKRIVEPIHAESLFCRVSKNSFIEETVESFTGSHFTPVVSVSGLIIIIDSFPVVFSVK